MDSTGRITLEIIERIRAGSESGIDECVRHWGPRLLVFIRYKLGSRLSEKVEPEDVLQDFFASLIQNREGFLEKIGERGVHRTVFRQIENRIKDLYEHFFKTAKRDAAREVREGGRSTGGSERFSFAQVAGPTASFSQRIETLDEYRSMVRIIDRLDEPKQRLFVLKFVEELTNQEIADELGVSLSTVKRSNAELVQTIQRVRREVE